MPIKSAYEKACERKLPSNFAKEIQRQQVIDSDLFGGIPDFVGNNSKPSHEYGESFVENNKTKSQIKPPHEMEDNPDEQILQSEIMEKNEDQIKPPQCHWSGNFTSYSGFARMNRTAAIGLTNKGMNVRLDMDKCPIDINSATLEALKNMAKMPISSSAPKVFGATVPLNGMHNGHKIAYTMIENSQTLHPDYIGKMNTFNEIWVPTNYNKKLFKDNNIFPKVWVMPLGVDTKRYTPNALKSDLKLKLKDFTFISVFKWNHRKGWPLLLRAYLEEFGSDDNVSLLLVSRTDIVHKLQTIIDDFNGLKKGINKTEADLPHVTLYDKLIKEREMPGLYKNANCFVLPSYGEGFNLPIMEAAACGLPTISTYCTAMTDYLDDNNSYLIHPDRFEPAKINGNLSNLAKHCRFYENQTFPLFETKALNSLKEHMRYVYENYDKAKEKGLNFTRKVHQQYTWDNSVDNIYNRLLELQ